MKIKKVVIEPIEDFFEEVKYAVKQHKTGKNVKLEYVSFNSVEELSRILSPRRKEIIDVVKKYNPSSIRELAQILKRDYKNVYKDVILLKKAGFLELKKEGKNLKPVVPYEEIEVIVKVGKS
ncbi:hypothetical protein [Aquifex aeolicus]|uniref:HVO_A0114 family putative DNA-binding protein n=1 Tax=Aquifex aeolicus TaxID=63363 RepID=UPI00031D922A|nr:hypothetical protein [Aquifex aeolicus]